MQAYLSFDGNCAEAFAFYAKALCGAITASHTFGQSPMAGNVPKEAQGRIMHIAMQADGMTLFGSDLMPGMPFEGFKGFSLSVQRQGVDVGAAVFKALSEGGQVTMPFAKTFWAEGFGMLVDRFGVPWMVNCEH
jgi:PhnB protein